MGIGYRESLILVGMLVFMLLMVAGIVWLIGTASKPPKEVPRSASERLAELESLRNTEQITAAEYEKQRAAIVSSV
jgi:outer membrane lipoprotein-sorting protein